MDATQIAYLNGEFTTLTATAPCYVNGEYSVVSYGTPAYIEGFVPPPPTSTQLCFMDGDFADPLGDVTSTKSMYMAGGGFTSTARAYISTVAILLGGTDCYIRGYDSETLDNRQAVRFDSTRQTYIRVPDSTQYDDATGFTLNLWVKSRVDSTGFNQGIVVREGVIETWVNSAGNSFGMRVKVNGTWYQALTTSFAKNRWYMLTMTYNGSAVRWYRNGVEFHSVNASGNLTDVNAPWYFGYYPTYNTYSDIDLSMVRMWNYALTPSEILAFYRPAYRSHCLECYVVIQEPTADLVTKRAFIKSDFSTGNPGVVESTLGLCIPTDSVRDSQGCYIDAGGQSEVEFDTRFVKAKSFTSWDTLINAQRGTNRINELQMGSVVYPITRYAYRKIDVPTSFAPNTDSSGQECYLHAGFTPEPASRNCYIVTPEVARQMRNAYIHGTYTAAVDSTPCVIVNNGQESIQGAYIEGVSVYAHIMTQRSHIVGFVETATYTLLSYLRGRGVSRLVQRAYVVAPNFAINARQCFIMSTRSETSTSRRLWMRGAVAKSASSACFIDGHNTATPSVGAYIPAVPTIDSSVGAFVQSENRVRLTARSYVRGREVIVDSQSLYLNSEVTAVGSVSAFTKGWAARIIAKRAHVNGPAPTVANSVKRCYVSNTTPVTSKMAYIVSGPQAFTRCFIISVGTTSVGKAVYLVNDES
jgi:hypothetical protein